MNLINRAASGVTLALALTVSAGCSGNTALIGRDPLPVRPSQPVQNELVATVERWTPSPEKFICSGTIEYTGEPGSVPTLQIILLIDGASNV